jgi:hypothetical protein
MIKLNKWLLIFPLLLLCLGISQFSFNSYVVPTDHSTSIHSPCVGALQNDAVHHENNLLNPHFRFHKGIFGSSIDISKLNVDSQLCLKLENNSYEVSHYSRCLLSQQEKIPAQLFLFTPSSLRAPPQV